MSKPGVSGQESWSGNQAKKIFFEKCPFLFAWHEYCSEHYCGFVLPMDALVGDFALSARVPRSPSGNCFSIALYKKHAAFLRRPRWPEPGETERTIKHVVGYLLERLQITTPH